MLLKLLPPLIWHHCHFHFSLSFLSYPCFSFWLLWEAGVNEKTDASEVDWSKLRTMVKKAGDCVPQALATANLAPFTFSLFPILTLLPLLLLLVSLGG